jgi:3-deoxy-D-manno-octulosonate 8-phosphate phosphatase KdsC-like HAD superfamily phosphatase
VAYVGNDVNDAGCLRVVGIPIVVQDAHPDVVPLARYRTRTAGGFGAVREVCEWLSSSVAVATPLGPQ